MLRKNCITPQQESQSETQPHDVSNSKPAEPSQPKKIVNISGGMQSTTLAALIFAEILEPVDCFIFADTGWERESTLHNIEKLKAMAADHGIPFHTVHGKTDVRSQAINPDYNFINMPIFHINVNGKKGMSKRQCTDHYKIHPIRKKIRELYPDDQIEQWIGISLDEMTRMRRSDVKYITNRYPLVEMKWTRGDCAEWLKTNGYGTPSKSSCIGCPFHDNATWLDLNEEERQDAIEVDEAIRDTYADREGHIALKPTREEELLLFDLDALDEQIDPDRLPQKNGMKCYLHQSAIPLAEFYDRAKETPADIIDLEDAKCGGDCFL